MSTASPAPPPRRTAAPARRRGILLPTALVVGGVLLLISLASGVYTDFAWYRQLGFDGVYTTRLTTQAVLFVVGALVMAAAVAASLTIAYRTRPVYAPVSQEAQNLDRYRESLEPLRKVVIVALPALLGLFAGSSAAARWETVLLFLNRTPFGTDDAQFGQDVGLYVFTLPFLGFLLGFLTAVAVLALLAAVATHYLYGGLRLQGPGQRTTRAARVHLASIAGLLALLQGVSYFLDRYSTVVDGQAAFVQGAGYTDVNAVIPARLFLAIIAVLVALLFFSTIVTGNWRIPIGGIGLLVVFAIIIGGVYPAIIQRFQVTPSERARESEYIQRNINGTTAAFGIGNVETSGYTPEVEGVQGALSADSDTAASIRLLDPAIVSPTFRQLQQVRNYYGFPDSLDVDRYTVDGQSQDTVVSVRELDSRNIPGNGSWINDHIVYTHGFGVVAAAGNRTAADGAPAFIEQNIPPTGQLGEYQPRIYFGEGSPDFSIVGAPEGAAPQELDFPGTGTGTGTAGTGTSSAEDRKNTYDGDGGPMVNNLFLKLLYAIKFRDQNILLSSSVTSASQILYDREPRDRVQKVAPWLTLDGDPYPAVVNGRVLWIVDGYTTSSQYPYSQAQDLGEATTTTATTATAVAALQRQQVNYIRNSVKATVDAYDGSVNLYAWDEEDPVLASWQKVFPGTVQPTSAIGGELMSHLRYPQDLFKVQRTVLENYHVEDANAFFTRENFWSLPADPTASGDSPLQQPPYYLTLRMPQQEQASFSLTSSYIPAPGQAQNDERSILTGFLAVDADAGDQEGEVRDGYGQLRLLELPVSAGTVEGPGQVQAQFNSDPQVSTQLNILRRGATRVRLGNLLTLPIGGGLLYVQPVYVQSTGGTQVPLLQRVAVSFGNTIAFEPTLDQALDQVFGGSSGAPLVEGQEPPTDGGTPPADGGTPPATDPTVAAALADAQTALQQGQAALAQGDFAAYGEAQTALADALQRAVEAEQAAGGGSEDAAAPAPEPAPGG